MELITLKPINIIDIGSGSFDKGHFYTYLTRVFRLFCQDRNNMQLLGMIINGVYSDNSSISRDTINLIRTYPVVTVLDKISRVLISFPDLEYSSNKLQFNSIEIKIRINSETHTELFSHYIMGFRNKSHDTYHQFGGVQYGQLSVISSGYFDSGQALMNMCKLAFDSTVESISVVENAIEEIHELFMDYAIDDISDTEDVPVALL